jgi:hypothetical protein
MEEREHATITEIDDALTHATNEHWRDWAEYVDKLLDQRLEVTQ